MSEKSLKKEALSELEEILSNNPELNYEYERIKRYYSVALKSLKQIEKEIEKKGGTKRICTYFNPDVHPPSEEYMDVYPNTKYGDHWKVSRTISNLKRSMPAEYVIERFLNRICEEIWKRDTKLNKVEYGSDTAEQMHYVGSFAEDFDNSWGRWNTEEMFGSASNTTSYKSAHILKKAYDKWTMKCKIIKSNALDGTTSMWPLVDMFSNILFECKHELGMGRGSRKKRKKKTKKRNRKSKGKGKSKRKRTRTSRKRR